MRMFSRILKSTGIIFCLFKCVSAQQCTITNTPIPISISGCTFSGSLPSNSTSYMQNSSVLQSGSTAYPSYLYVGSTATIPTLNVSSLTSGNCVQAGTNGLLTSSSGACGSGGITALTGDVTASGSGSVAVTAASIQANIKTFTQPITLTSSFTVTNTLAGIIPTTNLYEAYLTTSSISTGFSTAISTNSHVIYAGQNPTVGSCGSTPSGSVIGTDAAGTITVGGTAPTACTLTFASPYRSTPVCVVTDNSSTISDSISSISSTGFTMAFGIGGLAGGLVWYQCSCVGVGCL